MFNTARHLNNSQIYITLTIFTDALIDVYIIKVHMNDINTQCSLSQCRTKDMGIYITTGSYYIDLDHLYLYQDL